MADPVRSLAPRIQAWFRARYPQGLTDIQKRALPHTLAERNALILAPTGSGKTLSAFLSILSELELLAAEGQLPNATCAVYVSPLRSLDRDIHRNLQAPLEAINEGLPFTQRIRMEVRTGDTDLAERARQQRRRPHLLLTTVESLSALLSQSTWREGLKPFVVVVDEIHAFAENKRGSLLTLALERLEGRHPRGLQRIGLSATAHPVSAVQMLLCGERPCEVLQLDVRKSFELSIAVPIDGPPLPPAGFNAFRVAHTVGHIVERHSSSLIFTTTRSAAEKLGLALKVLLPEEEERIDVHHGSIDRSHREEIERRLAEGEMKAVVASSSLELGVDFSAVDHVVLIGAPRGVSRTLQRIGRSGHRVDGVARGTLVPLNTLDLVECIALLEAARNGKLDELRIPRAPLDVLAQVVLGLCVERSWNIEEAWQLIQRAGPYKNLNRQYFDLILDYLQGGGKVLGPYGTYGKIIVRDGNMMVASRKVAREYYMNVGTISDDFSIRIVTQKNRQLGSVEEGFLGSLQPGEAFLVAGKPVVVERMMQNVAVVRPATGERVNTPRWMGQKIPLSAQLASEELRLRRALRQAIEDHGIDAARQVLLHQWHVTEDTADTVIRFLTRQMRAAPIPIDDPVQVEVIPDGRAVILHFHVLAGRAVNQSLAWVAGYRLAGSGSVVGNFDDHSFMLSLAKRQTPTVEQMRAAFDPQHFADDLFHVVSTTESVGFGFRQVAETGQLLPKRTTRGRVTARSQTWNAKLLYETIHKHEPEHPLVQEAIREVIEDRLDGTRAQLEAARMHQAQWEVFHHPRPSPFSLPLYAAFNREILLAQDPDKALDELVMDMLEQWDEPALAHE